MGMDRSLGNPVVRWRCVGMACFVCVGMPLVLSVFGVNEWICVDSRCSDCVVLRLHLAALLLHKIL